MISQLHNDNLEDASCRFCNLFAAVSQNEDPLCPLINYKCFFFLKYLVYEKVEVLIYKKVFHNKLLPNTLCAFIFTFLFSQLRLSDNSIILLSIISHKTDIQNI